LSPPGCLRLGRTPPPPFATGVAGGATGAITPAAGTLTPGLAPGSTAVMRPVEVHRQVRGDRIWSLAGPLSSVSHTDLALGEPALCWRCVEPASVPRRLLVAGAGTPQQLPLKAVAGGATGCHPPPCGAIKPDSRPGSTGLKMVAEVHHHHRGGSRLKGFHLGGYQRLTIAEFYRRRMTLPGQCNTMHSSLIP
jgi:hypothetical protein